MTQQKPFPAKAEIVIVGGGVIGCSTALNLARKGFTDVVLLEKNDIGSGASCKAAGQITAGGVTAAHLQIMKHSWDYMEEFVSNGDIKINRYPLYIPVRENDPEELKEILRGALKLSKDFGAEDLISYLTRDEALEMYPALNKGDMCPMGHNLGKLEGLFGLSSQQSGFTDPYLVTNAYAKYARKAGIDIRTKTPVTDIILDDGKITAVVTPAGTSECSKLVIAAGCWSKKIGEMIGLDVPIKPVRRLGFIVKPNEEVTFKFPPVTDELEAMTPRKGLYVREDVDGMFMGAGSHEVLGLDDEIDPDEMDPGYNLNEVVDFADKLEQLLPDFPDFDVVDGWAGFYACTPDSNYIVDKVDGIEGLYLNTGLSGEGISASGGAGLFMAELLLDGKISSCEDPSHWAWNAARFPDHAKK